MRTLFLIAILLSSTSLATAQTDRKSASKPTSLGQAESDSNQDKNIRTYIELLRSDVKKAKTQIISEVMQFDADESAKFWPVYKEFESEFTKIGDSIHALIKDYAANYGSMTPEVADRLATKLLDVEQARHDLKKKYYDRIKRVLDPIIAARFLQVENQLERLVDLQLAAQLPVID